MATDAGPEGFTMISPEDAFAILGNEVRLEILQTLGVADEPLAYSELFEYMDYDDPGNFSYHLDKLVGHFVGKSDDGYRLRRPGERVMEAVLSGAVTSDPVRDPIQTDWPCPFCSTGIEIGYQQERVTMYCPECPGIYGQEGPAERESLESGTLGAIPLPPAGVEDRTAAEMRRVAEIWTATSMQAIARGVCPRCSGAVDHSIHVCEDHDVNQRTCDRCGRRFGAMASASCTNCVFDMEAPVAGHLAVHPQVMAVMIENGVDPVAPEGNFPYAAVDETILSPDPFEARYTYTIDGDALTLTVNDNFPVVDVTRGQNGEAG